MCVLSADQVEIFPGDVMTLLGGDNMFLDANLGAIHCIANDLPWGVLRNGTKAVESDVRLTPDELDEYVKACKPVLNPTRGIIAFRIAQEMVQECTKALRDNGFAVEGPMFMICDAPWSAQKSFISHKHKTPAPGDLNRTNALHCWVIGHLRPENRVPIPKIQCRKLTLINSFPLFVCCNYFA